MSASRLAVSLVALVLAFAGVLPDAYLADQIYFLHPTIHHAYEDSAPEHDNIDMETVRIHMSSRNRSNWRFDPNYRSSEDIAATSAWPQNPAYSPFNITYKMEQEAIRSNLESISGKTNETTCHYYSAFRAYELVMSPKDNASFAIGITDNYACLIEFKAPFVYEEAALILKNTTNVKSSRVLALPYAHGPWYAPSAVTAGSALNVSNIIGLTLYDEAGKFVNAKVDIKIGMRIEKIRADCMTTIILDDTTPCDLSFDRRIDKEKVIEPKTSFEHLQTHFNHSLVESIYFFDNTLCWSTGWRVPSLEEFRCFNGGLAKKKQDKASFRALETYRYNNRVYKHELLLEDSKDWTDPYPLYGYFNAEEVSELEKSRDESKLNNYLLPVDIVYAAKCQKLFAIYMHMYQEFKPDERLDTDSKYIAIDWMTFPVNAILYHRDRLYLFSSGNKLKITSELTADCDLTQVSVEPQDYYQSDLLLAFAAQVANKTYEKLLPIYDSNKWFKNFETPYPIEDYTEVPASLHLAKLAEISGNIPSSNISVMVIIALLLLVGIICGIIYFVCYTGSPEAAINPKSKSRKQANLPPSQLSSSDGRPGVSGSRRPGSTLSPTPTVRSADLVGLAGASKFEYANLAKKVGQPIKFKKSTASAKSIRSPGVMVAAKSARSPGGSPKSAGSLHSKRSQGVAAHKSISPRGTRKVSPKK